MWIHFRWLKYYNGSIPITNLFWSFDQESLTVWNKIVTFVKENWTEFYFLLVVPHTHLKIFSYSLNKVKILKQNKGGIQKNCDLIFTLSKIKLTKWFLISVIFHLSKKLEVCPTSRCYCNLPLNYFKNCSGKNNN